MIEFPRRPLIMGIVNINDDSFAGDGSLQIERALQLLNAMCFSAQTSSTSEAKARAQIARRSTKMKNLPESSRSLTAFRTAMPEKSRLTTFTAISPVAIDQYLAAESCRGYTSGRWRPAKRFECASDG